MPRLPNVANVPSQSSGRDPGVQAPSAAFKTPTETLSASAATATENFAKIKQNQENRQDTINRAEAMNTFRESTDAELRRIQSEEDLSNPETLNKFGQYMSEQQQKLVEQYGGSPESRTHLYARLGEISSEFTGQASGLSAAISRDKVKTMFDQQIKPIMMNVSRNPSPENMNNAFLKFDEVLNDTKGAYNPADEEKMREAGREQITLSALEPMLTQGHVETADALLNEGGMYQYLSPDTLRRVQNRMAVIREQRDQADTKMTEHDKIRKNLMDRGYSKDLAFDISAGNVKVYGPDPSGDYYKINLVTKKKEKIGEQDAQVLGHETKVTTLMNKYPSLSMSAAQEMVDAGVQIPGITDQPTQPTAGGQPSTPASGGQPAAGQDTSNNQTSIESTVESGVGPINIMREKISNLVGPFVKGAIYEDTTNARQALKLFNLSAKQAFASNPKFPVAEQKMILNALPDEAKFFKDPDTAKNDMGVFRNLLEQRKKLKEDSLNSSETTSRMKANLKDEITTIDEVLSMMGPAPKEPIKVTSQEEVNNLKKGDRFIWTDGKTYTKD